MANFRKGMYVSSGQRLLSCQEAGLGKEGQQAGRRSASNGPRKVTETLPVPLRGNKYLSTVGTEEHCSAPEYVFQGFFHWHELSKPS